jgi:sugar lactone lactonase YvrE
MSNPLRGWSVDRDEITFVGHDLQRPECVLAERDGTLWSADARGGVMRIDADGTQTLVAQEVVNTNPPAHSDSVSRYILEGTLPNGLAFDRGGDFIIANFGTDAVERMTRDGVSETLLETLDGKPLGKANFALTDSKGRIWITVHTRSNPWLISVNEKLPDGYIILIDELGARIAADGFIGTNEIRFDANEEWLYVVESNARHISRLRVADDGTLYDREVYGPRDLGGIPDGFAFDVAGNLWITLVNGDRLIALTPELEVLTLLDDGNPAGVAAFDRAYFAGTMTPEVLGGGRGTLAPLMASVTFGGPDLKTVYLGSLMGTTLPSFRSPVAGLPMAHWHA